MLQWHIYIMWVATCARWNGACIAVVSVVWWYYEYKDVWNALTDWTEIPYEEKQVIPRLAIALVEWNPSGNTYNCWESHMARPSSA